MIPTINNIEIKCNEMGLYSLNDLHKASGGDANKRPANFLKSPNVDEFIKELVSNSNCYAGSNIITKKPGRYGGTWVSSDVVYLYATWINPKFHVKVIQTFRALIEMGISTTKITSVLDRIDKLKHSSLSPTKRADKLSILETEYAQLMSDAGKMLALGRGKPAELRDMQNEILNEIQDSFEF